MNNLKTRLATTSVDVVPRSAVRIARGAAAKRTLPEYIVAFMSFSSDSCDYAGEFQKFRTREWERAFKWLDAAGLAFYFLQKLRNTNTTDAIPACVMSRLQRNFEANQQRVDYMQQQFEVLNQKLKDASVRFVVLKGLSLIPQFCPDRLLRYQGDFDYLVDEQSLGAAQQVLVEAGYRSKPSPSSQEFIFLPQGMGEPSRRADQYYARTPHAVELHLDIWDCDLDGVSLTPNLFSVERATTHHFNGVPFAALADEDAFLLQVLHTCHHMFSHWVRMSCLLEIAYFLSQYASHQELWSRIEARVGDCLILREFVVVVTEMAAKLFAAPLPELVQDWGLTIRTGPRVWIDNYARQWVFGELPIHQFCLFPGAKLVRFLHQQFKSNASNRESLPRNRLLPPSRLSRIASSVRDNPWLLSHRTWWIRHLLIQRSLFHLLAGLRYLVEIPRWLSLNRARMHLSSAEVESLDRPLPVIADGKTGSSQV
ncbi:MAG TPA: nucleotidyltransferase family protein [Candidatus Sulfotelmatobacter sp.]